MISALRLWDEMGEEERRRRRRRRWRKDENSVEHKTAQNDYRHTHTAQHRDSTDPLFS
jgi:hypothetical protein